MASIKGFKGRGSVVNLGGQGMRSGPWRLSEASCDWATALFGWPTAIALIENI